MGTEHRGFASMDMERRRAIASKGGQAAHAKGTAHRWNQAEAREAGRKGGYRTHENREKRKLAVDSSADTV